VLIDGAKLSIEINKNDVCSGFLNFFARFDNNENLKRLYFCNQKNQK